jgi:hypothetical protein
LDEGEEVEGKLVVACADAAETFDALEEVLHAEAELVEASVPTGRVLAVLQVGDAGTAPGVPYPVTESVGIEALVGPQPVSRRNLDPVRTSDVGLDARVHDELEGAALVGHQRGNLGVEATTGGPAGHHRRQDPLRSLRLRIGHIPHMDSIPAGLPAYRE